MPGKWGREKGKAGELLPGRAGEGRREAIVGVWVGGQPGPRAGRGHPGHPGAQKKGGACARARARAGRGWGLAGLPVGSSRVESKEGGEGGVAVRRFARRRLFDLLSRRKRERPGRREKGHSVGVREGEKRQRGDGGRRCVCERERIGDGRVRVFAICGAMLGTDVEREQPERGAWGVGTQDWGETKKEGGEKQTKQGTQGGMNMDEGKEQNRDEDGSGGVRKADESSGWLGPLLGGGGARHRA